ncbi:MAG TPA: CHAT domain-containing protein [Chloroflexota bacterium]|nr:CHAT domain-containing protein [Chloroflexota bacterium]
MDTADAGLETIIEQLSTIADAALRRGLLTRAITPDRLWALAESLKAEAERVSYADRALALRWAGDIVALGEVAEAPTVVALGWMVEALIRYLQGQAQESLALFDLAGARFREHGDQIGWARTQIGRTNVCMQLGRYDEALIRAQEARSILERAGDRLRMATIDYNLAVLLERTNQPVEALGYCERAWTVYHELGTTFECIDSVSLRGLLLRRLGRVREALREQQEAQQGYAALGATAEVAREELNIGLCYLTLERFAEAMHSFSTARDGLAQASSAYLAAFASMHLVECSVRVGRFRAAAMAAASLAEEFLHLNAAADAVQTLVWQSRALTGLHEHDGALAALDRATMLLAGDPNLTPYCTPLAFLRAQTLLDIGRVEEGCRLLEVTIPGLIEAGLSIEAAHAQIVRGLALLRQACFDEAQLAAGQTLAVAEREGIDWLRGRALHLRGRVALQTGERASARSDFAAAIRALETAQRRITWDDRVAFADGTAMLYADAVSLSLDEGHVVRALRYAERGRARALVDHLSAGIDVRLRARDERSRTLIEDLTALRERYAWLCRTRGGSPDDVLRAQPVRAAPDEAVEAVGQEIAGIEARLAAIWRELQEANPAYREEAAALDLPGGALDDTDQDVTLDRWLARMQQALGAGDATVLLDYMVLGDDLVLFVVRSGVVRALRLPDGHATLRQLVPLWRMIVERSAAALGNAATMRVLCANARGLLGRLFLTLLAPAMPLLAGATRAVIVPHGLAHHVPFHALHTGAGYLIEQMEVAYAPCADLVEHFTACWERAHAPRSEPPLPVLVLARSASGALPATIHEAQAVAAALGGQVLLEEAATLAQLRGVAPRCLALHLATHGTFRPDEPLFSAVELADGPLTTLEVFDLDLSCSLVTLSACETALGRSGAGDEVMGLSRAFLYAGGSSLLLSLWKVDDHSTAQLMQVFYQALAQGHSKARALREAQCALIHQEAGGVDLSAPFFWAPFQLIGHAGPL